MIDIHCHILPGLDDGSADWETTLEMLRIAEGDGITGIIATPHILDNVSANLRLVCDIQKLVKECNRRAGEAGFNIKVYPGSEVMATRDIHTMIQKKEVLSPSPNNRYLLIEFPPYDIPDWAELMIFQCLLHGTIPVICHPERNRKVQKNPEILYDLVIKGALCQMDAPSIIGSFGRATRKTAEKLLCSRLIHFIASDAHNAGPRPPRLSEAFEIVCGLTGKELADSLFRKFPKAVLEGVDFAGDHPINPVNLFSRIFLSSR